MNNNEIIGNDFRLSNIGYTNGKDDYIIIPEIVIDDNIEIITIDNTNQILEIQFIEICSYEHI